MFKYVSEIISQFSRSQKILALLILCFSIILVTILPSFISTITLDRSELENKISERDLKIRQLSYNFNSLDSTVRVNQKKCTDDAFKREIEFKKMLQEIQDDLILNNFKSQKIRNSYIIKDTSSFIVNEAFIPTMDLSPLIKKVGKMKNQIKDK